MATRMAGVWLTMTRGQETLTMDLGAPPRRAEGAPSDDLAPGSTDRGGPLLVVEPTADESAAHRDYLAALDKETKGRCVWLVLEPAQRAA